MKKVSDFRNKEVINVSDGKRLGFVCDVEIDFEKGSIDAIVIPGPAGLFNMFAHTGDYIVPWTQIKKIGEDIILVDYPVAR